MNQPLMFTPLTENQKACVDLLNEALDEAKKGMIDTIAVIACLKTGYATVMAGSRAGDLNLGCDSLKKKILEAVERPHRIVTGGQ